MGRQVIQVTFVGRSALKLIKPGMTDPQFPLDTDSAILRRKTQKVLASAVLPADDKTGVVEELLALAGMAPFHRACEESHRIGKALSGIEPWRFHCLNAAVCRKLSTRLTQEDAGKIPAMLAAADALLLVTWLPNATTNATRSDDAARFEPTLGNMEHIAAASAAIENLLLAATARGIANYWSSGGVLRTDEVFAMLGVPTTEILLGAVFLFPAEIGNAELVGSKLREHRSAPGKWSRWITVE